ncbi:outer membrane lipid asymmetry maintenance protein MlaD [Candidatus Njordibacter sp. Uisw_056]|jgi:phospholipid/cholesterol/gamma-HCH transport system substrate-binding protein|uniref:outer membrane lipid asymmetry maintenance protein MlaD n=1 Tax=Candidatus Njordibacter sp. Uisw_056 TaxID=3230973 RepID=UPI003D4A6693|tara:strand:- start:248 stop:709 length:462 start_codon:yes stop_codon:yes gene_type:complete
MNKKWLELSVGLMMVAGVAALVALALQVSGGNMSRNAQSYAISALFENAAGLGPKAKVTMAGVTVGEVVSVVIDPNALMAKVNMEIYGQVDYLSIDSSASILTAGLLGEKYVGLTVGAEEEVLVDGDVIEDTQSALVLEELIGQFLLNFGDNK